MSATWHPRESLGLRAPNLERISLRTAEMLTDQLGETIHHTGADGTLFKPDPIARLRGIQDYHMDVLGYGDIAYEGAFDADGNTYGLRDGRYVGAHALNDHVPPRNPGAWTPNTPNEYTSGIVFLEDVRGFTPAASAALTWWQQLYVFIYRRECHLFAHEWWSVTQCPGSYLIAAVASRGGST